ncbi:HipA domain-containing protein [Cupriavidus sp. BIC8F]|uniref:HipA domain-containing protein n=1 Tax=Cupriavidus sp. BIC8F TaxID=3079014 RepID=UPI0029165625|nr:HipA domain-containing protein [Cupriavidus sp. BIC8F]
MQHVLYVWAHGEPVGQLAFEPMQDQYTFAYHPDWQARDGAYSLSPHIPVTGEVPVPGAVARFLGNLLPEGHALEVASSLYHVSKSNIYALIRRLGKEPVGALSFVASEEEQDPGALSRELLEPVRREISPEELAHRIQERAAIPFPVWDGQVRLSIAGFQDKLQVLVEGENFSLVDGSLSSTHILKPESVNPLTQFIVANEHYCMSLAASMGLPVAPVSIRRIPAPVLLIERFDRIVTPDPEFPDRAQSVRRLHVIDGCQALDLPHTYKYERNLGHTRDVANIRDGASFEKLFSLTPHLETPVVTQQFMLRWAILQLLLGNSDAHGKNISFFVKPGGLAPAPIYDLVAVNVYGNAFIPDMAMAYGDVFLIDELTPFALADFAKRANIRPVLLAREMTRLAKLALQHAPEQARNAVYTDDERALVQQISDFVCVQANRLLSLAPHVPKVNSDLL